MGGLSKKAFQFNKIAKEANRPHLTLDAGALLFKHDAINPRQEEQEKMAAAAIVEAYSLIGYNAVCVGSQDLIAGSAFLQMLSKDAKFTWLSANLVNKSTKKTFFKASTTVNVEGVKVGVIGLTGPAALPPADEATILPWDQVLPDLLAKVDKTHDLVVLLSNLPAADSQRIALSYPSIHLIIQSGANTNAISPEPINNTVLVSTGPQGKQIGIMEINWQPSKRWGDQKTEVLAKKKGALDRLLWQLSKYQQDKDPETALRNQPDQLNIYHALQAQEQELRGEIDQLSKTLDQQGPSTGEPSAYTNRFMAMETALPDQPEIVRLVDALNSAVNKLGQRQAETATKTDSPYLGSRSCGSCHAAQLASWQKTRHAAAYATLAKDKQQYNLSCLPCHVTGVSMDQASESLSITEARREVGCETCHGPGRLHIGNPKANPMALKPGPGVCQTCHSGSHDDNFNYDERIKMVDHH